MEFFRRLKGESGYSDLQAFDPEKDRAALDLSKPTLFFFPGILSIDHAKFVHHSYSPSGNKLNVQTSEDSVAYKTEVIERIIGRPEMHDDDKTRFFAMTYTPPQSFMDAAVDRLLSAGRKILGQTFTGKFFDLWNHSANPAFTSQDAKKFTADILWPALLDESGQLLPFEALQTKLRNLTFFGDSFGSSFAHQVANSLAAQLFDNNLRPENIQRLLQEIVFIGASNVVQSEKVANPFTAICFEGNGDKLIHASRGLNHRYRSGVMPRQLSAILSLASSQESEWLHEVDEPNRNDSGDKPMEFNLDKLPEQLRNISSSFSFTEISGNGSDDLNPLLRYQPDEQSTVTDLRATNPSYIRVAIEPPQNYAVCLHRGGNRTYRSYSNAERHQSYCYTYPFPGKRDHSDLLARTLRNALLRGEKSEKTSPTQLLGEASHARGGDGFSKETEDAINLHLDSLVNPHLPDLATKLTALDLEKRSADAYEAMELERRFLRRDLPSEGPDPFR